MWVNAVDKYCHLGVKFENNCSWSVLFEEFMKKGERQNNLLMFFLTPEASYQSVELKSVILTCVRLIVENRAGVYLGSKHSAKMGCN
jgi:hypothetical protein